MNVGHGSNAKRKVFHQRFVRHLSGLRESVGAVMVPLLVDPNNRDQGDQGPLFSLVESADIVK